MGWLTVGVLKENLSVDTSGTNQRRIQGLDLVGSHDDLDVATIIETIQLVEKLQHGSLDFTFTSGRGLVTLGTDSIDLVDKDDARGVLGSDLEDLST